MVKAMIVVREYDSSWPAVFAAERERLTAALGDDVAVEHIGSTAVPGLAAKPIIDIAAGLRDDAAIAGAIQVAAGLGYVREPAGDFEERRFLRRLGPDGEPTHHLSLTRRGSAYWIEHLAFRDALRADAGLMRRYGELKQRLAGESEDMDAYTRAKTALVREALIGAGHTPASGWAAEDS
jgi:GrpB-like predicted nucleotidyltransferase (UPF0157 family)